MHPVLIDFGYFPVGTYGFLLAVAFVCAIALAMHRAHREGIAPGQILDLSCYLLFSAIVGAKLLLVIVEWKIYLRNPAQLPQVFRLGGVYYGGFILAVLVGLWYVRRKRLNTWQVADVLAPSIALGQAIGRLGCFMGGCCYGKSCDLPWAIRFTDPAAFENVGVPLHQPLHPTQLYSAFNALVILVLLLLITRRKSFHGQIFWIYVGLYSAMRFLVEFFRGDHRGAIFGDALSTSQFLGLLLLVTSVAAYRLLSRTTKR